MKKCRKVRCCTSLNCQKIVILSGSIKRFIETHFAGNFDFLHVFKFIKFDFLYPTFYVRWQ